MLLSHEGLMRPLAFFSVFVLLSATLSSGYYIPGIKPVSYNQGDEVSVYVNSVRSPSEFFPLNYYRFPFCQPTPIVHKPEVIGEIIWGDRVMSSDYKVSMLKNCSCMLLPCSAKQNVDLVRSQLAKFTERINKGYRAYINIDNLPAFSVGEDFGLQQCATANVPESHRLPNQRGYAVGVHEACVGSAMINNHLHFRIGYHEVPDNEKIVQYRVVGFRVEASSVKHPEGGCSYVPAVLNGKNNTNGTSIPFIPMRDNAQPLTVSAIPNYGMYWSYSVEWVNEPDVSWSTRWDSYFQTSQANQLTKSHWLYIGCSTATVILLLMMVSTILMRALHRDFNRYNAHDPDDMQEEVGWKLIHADVFRPPDYAWVLSIAAGNGIQLLGMLLGVLFFSLLGLLSPANRGSLLSCMIVLFVMMSFLGGYACATLMKYFNCARWKHAFLCGTVFPGSMCFIYTIIDLVNSAHGATTAVPFLTLLAIVSMWLLVSIPLTLLGAALAFQQETIQNPVRVGRLAREIPVQQWYHTYPFLAIYSLCPFLIIFIELRFILQGVWQGMVYYVFGFLTITVCLWILTVALSTIVGIYYVLCYENHQWWWLSFALPGLYGLPVFLYSIHFYSALNVTSAASTFVYFMYMAAGSLSYGLVAGSIGLCASIAFVRLIYAAIKVD